MSNVPCPVSNVYLSNDPLTNKRLIKFGVICQLVI